MVRSKLNGSAKRAALGIALLVPFLLAGCASGDPRDTNYDWNLSRDPRPHHAHYNRNAQHYAWRRDEAPIAPRPKPQPAWYSQDSLPPAHGNVNAGEPIQVAGPVRFEWPVQGRVIAEFGSSASGERNDGINIAAQMGTPIHAAAGGTVTYAGSDLRTYGNLVLIRHEDGYVTAYAHAESLVVSRGDQVARGQIIGYTGNSGDVDQPQLHFEIRHGVNPVDPRPYLVAWR